MDWKHNIINVTGTPIRVSRRSGGLGLNFFLSILQDKDEGMTPMWSNQVRGSLPDPALY